MRSDEVTSRKSTDERKLACHTCRGDDAGELLGVLTGVGWVGSFDAEHLENGSLGCEDGTTTDGADFDTGHGDGHEKIFTMVGSMK